MFKTAHHRSLQAPTVNTCLATRDDSPEFHTGFTQPGERQSRAEEISFKTGGMTRVSYQLNWAMETPQQDRTPEEAHLRALEGDEEFWDHLDELEVRLGGAREWDNPVGSMK